MLKESQTPFFKRNALLIFNEVLAHSAFNEVLAHSALNGVLKFILHAAKLLQNFYLCNILHK